MNNQFYEIDLNDAIDRIRSGDTWKQSDKGSAVLFKSESMRIVLMGLRKEAELKTHTANGRICVHLLEGKVRFDAEGQLVALAKGNMITLQEKIPHSVFALEESFFLLTIALIK